MRAALLLTLSVVLVSAVAVGQPHRDDFMPGSEFTLPLKRDDGKKGFAVFPAEFSGTRPTRIINPSGFHAHFTDADNPGKELIFPAGELFDPPTGRFRYWLQDDWSMTPFTELASFRPNRPAGAKSIRVLPVVPAGRVIAAAEPAPDPDHQLRLLYAGVDPMGGVRHELSRRRVVSELGDGILMPAGRVLGALWDRREERYVAISRPFMVYAGKQVSAPLQRPRPDVADLLVYVDRPEGTPGSAVPGLVLTATRGGDRRTADLTVTTPWGVYGVWYSLKPAPVVLGGANERLYLAPVTVPLSGGRITRYLGTLSRQLFTPGSTRPPP